MGMMYEYPEIQKMEGIGITTIDIEDVKDIKVASGTMFVRIDFTSIQGSTTRLVLEGSDAEYLSKLLTETFSK